MGAVTAAKFITENNFLIGNRKDPGATNTTRTAKWLREAYTYMCHPSVHLFREMQAIDNTTALLTGINEYNVGTIGVGAAINVVALRWVTHIQATSYTPTAKKRKLRPRGIRSFEQRTLSTGQPTLYTLDGNSIFISGVPTSNENGQLLRIGFFREPAAIAGGSVTVLNTYYDRPLQKFMQAFAEADLGNRAKAFVILREAMGLLNNAEEETELEAEEEGWQVEFTVQSAMGI